MSLNLLVYFAIGVNSQESHSLKFLKQLEKMLPTNLSENLFSVNYLIAPFTPPFTLIEEAFAIGCFRGWGAKFAKSISTKKTYTPFAQISSREKRFLTCSTKINSGEKDFLVYSAKWKFPRKNISPKINTTSYAKKVLIHLRNTFLSSQTINMFYVFQSC